LAAWRAAGAARLWHSLLWETLTTAMRLSSAMIVPIMFMTMSAATRMVIPMSTLTPMIMTMTIITTGTVITMRRGKRATTLSMRVSLLVRCPGAR